MLKKGRTLKLSHVMLVRRKETRLLLPFYVRCAIPSGRRADWWARTSQGNPRKSVGLTMLAILEDTVLKTKVRADQVRIPVSCRRG